MNVTGACLTVFVYDFGLSPRDWHMTDGSFAIED